MTNNILIGKVNSAFGIKGEVKIISFCQEPTQIENYSLSDADGNDLKLRISNKNKAVVGTSSGNAILIAKIDGVNDRNKAEEMRGQELFVKREDFDETDEDEFYYVDLIGLDVVFDEKKVGKVVNVHDFGAGAMLEINFDKEFVQDKARNLNKTENILFKDENFPKVDIKANVIELKLPEIEVACE